MNEIIPLNQEHIAECAQLVVEVFNAEPWNDHWHVEAAYQRLNDIYHTPNFEGIIYREDGQVKGAIFGNYEHFYNGIHFYLKEMFISNALQGKGIGSKMLGILEERLKAKGVTNVYLLTLNHQRTSQFYQRNGFNTLDDMIMMKKNL